MGSAVAVWAVLAGGFASTVSILALMLAGAAVGGVASLPLIACAAGTLAAASAGLIAAVHRTGGAGGWLRRLPGTRRARRAAVAAGRLMRLRAGRRRWTAALMSSGLGWLGDTGVLAASFGLAGLPVPWRGLLFACAVGQVAGRLVPLPGGLGGMEGGLIGALALTGTTPGAAAAAVILYRVIGYWAVGGAGGAVLAALTHGHPGRRSRADETQRRLLLPPGVQAAGLDGCAPGPEGAGLAGHGESVRARDMTRGLPPGGPLLATARTGPPAGAARTGPPAGAARTGPPAGAARTGPPAGAARTRPRWRLQFVLVVALLWAVDAADKLHGGVESAGFAHARVIESVSGYLGGGVGLAMNQWLAAHPLPAAAAAAYYIVLNVVVTGAAGLLLLRSRPPGFALHRNALIAMGLIALLVFWLYPVAPPRMLPGYHDIAAASVPVFAHLLEARAGDQFAALPSLHVAWALWVAVASQALLSRPFWRAAVWVYPAVTMLDVLATANHYLLDVVAAPALVLLAYVLAALISRVSLPGRDRPAGASRRR